MSNQSRTWILIGLSVLIVIGVALILVPLLTPNIALDFLTPGPTALIIDQSDLPYPAVPRITVGDAQTALELNQAVFIDVRSEQQYARGHITGAKSMPLNELESHLTELNKDQPIITYCT
ncbi:thiosulfate sulfurtransferase [Thermoflexales bacterium]|nr:thiosulfate sulfurtransferase [Thermoflexales bacterium]